MAEWKGTPERAAIADHELTVFLEEANELIHRMEEGLLSLEQRPEHSDVLQELFRAAHTLKSSAAMVGLGGMSELTHAMEDFFDQLRAGSLTVAAGAIDTLLDSLDAIKAIATSVAAGGDGQLDVSSHLQRLRSLTRGDTPDSAGGEQPAIDEVVLDASPEVRARAHQAQAGGRRLLQVAVTLDESPERRGVRCYQVLGELAALGEVIVSVPSPSEIDAGAAPERFILLVAVDRGGDGGLRPAVADLTGVAQVDVQPYSAPTDRPAERAESEPSREMSRSMRVDLEQLDRLMNTAGELVVDRTRLSELTRALRSRYGQDELVLDLCDTSAHLVRTVDELNDGMSKVRMVPIAALFSSMPRLVRDLARATGKKVNLVIDGEETELDRSIIDQIREPLIHVLRNAIDHGIEPPEERRAAGKSLPAIIRVSAHHGDGRVVVAVQDDGQGINVERVKGRAVERGLLTSDEAERLADADVCDLIFEPGFSTARGVTETSGRGVGMDIVRRSTSALNGTVEVDSTPGTGTTVIMRLPLTVATFRALLVEALDTVYAIPLDYVLETAKLSDDLLATVLGHEVFMLRGEAVPLFRLSHLRTGRTAASHEASSVVVQAGDRPLALGVDALIDQREVVTKPLSTAHRFTAIAGASILGDGRVALILDTAALASSMPRAAIATQG